MKRQPLVRLYEDEGCIDGFAGGGGTSTGIEMALGRAPDFAINHDAEALAMHRANHPETHHVQSNIREVKYERLMPSQRCGFAWFSPDCTFHSKARGGRPFRDRDRARRIRGLAWEAVRCAVAIRPRVLFVENVEEFQYWSPLGEDGQLDPTRKGQSFRRWVSRLRNIGYHVEWRELRASDFGAPTSRKRLFVIARCDGQPIVWPAATHGKQRRRPYQTAAACIDFSLPVPSIFLTPSQAKAWGKAHGVAAPKRPLAKATLRRIARGLVRFVVESPDPFIVRFAHGERDASGKKRGRGEHSVFEPLPTLTTTNEFGLVTPYLASVRHHDDTHLYPVDEPMRTITSSDREFVLVAPTLINTRNGERHGRHGNQAPRIYDIRQPYATITAQGSQGALVAAFLAKHNAGHEATGQRPMLPLDTITTRDSKALVTAVLMNNSERRGERVYRVDEPVRTLTASGCRTYQLVSAFLTKFYGTKKDGVPLTNPLDTVTTKERFGLVTVTINGEPYAIVDIGMRMLTPRELFRAQGFPDDYEITNGVAPDGRQVPFTKKTQTRLVGNSVPPHVAAALIGANLTEAVA